MISATNDNVLNDLHIEMNYHIVDEFTLAPTNINFIESQIRSALNDIPDLCTSSCDDSEVEIEFDQTSDDTLEVVIRANGRP